MRSSLKISGLGWRTFLVWRRNAKVWSKYYKASILSSLGEPLLYLLGLGYGLGRFIQEIHGLPYVQYLAPGLVMSAAMYSAIFECTYGSLTRIIHQRTYDAIIATPVSIEEVITGDILWGSTRSVISGLILVVLLYIFSLISNPFGGIIMPFYLLFVGFMFASMAMLVTAYAPSYDFYAYFFTLWIAPMFLFSGIFFPLSGLPDWVGFASWCFPLTHAVNISRGIIMGYFKYSFIFDFLWMIIFSAIVFYISIRRLRKRLIQ